jgi:DNA polymerase-3 subunit gamma/tau
MFGNETTIRTLKRDLAKKDHPHAFLMSGGTGCGKTTLARIIAKEIGAVKMNFREVDSADYTGVDNIREMRKQASFSPLGGGAKCWLLDEVHKLSNGAQNALLKALEEAKDTTYYILATTDPQKLLKTIIGRCSHYKVNPLSDSETMGLLRHVVKCEDSMLSKKVYEKIIETSEGHPRNALNILDQVLSADKQDQLEVAGMSMEGSKETIELYKALLNQKSWGIVAKIIKSLQENKEDAEQIRLYIRRCCANALMWGKNDRAAQIMEEIIDHTYYESKFDGLIFDCYSIVEG